MSIEELEKLRKKAYTIQLIWFICTILLFVVMIITTKNIPLSFIIMIIGIVFTVIFSASPTKRFTSEYKKTLVSSALKSIFTDLTYEPERGLAKSIIGNTGMMNLGDRYSSNDYISGKYNNVNVVQADVHIEKKTESRNSNGTTDTQWYTIFQGRWMVFDFNKSFKYNLQVCQKGFYNSIVNNWGNNIKFKKVALEEQEFNKQFKVYAQNEQEAFYILTPTMMEKIKKLSNSINGKILLCFIDNKLHVGIENDDDAFEPSIFVKVDETSAKEKILKDIKLITDFVDGLDLDNDLFKVEV